MVDEVSEAYSRRAAEYIELFGSMRAVHPSDRQLVSTWAEMIEGAAIDAGCGPGHWTNFLTEQGLATCGVDLVPEFIERARSTYPAVPFTVGSLDELDFGPEVQAWVTALSKTLAASTVRQIYLVLSVLAKYATAGSLDIPAMGCSSHE